MSTPDQPTVPAPGPTRAAEGLREWAATVLRFYDAERERTRLYGDHEKPLADSPYHQGYQQAMRDLLRHGAALAEADEGEGEAGAAGLTDEERESLTLILNHYATASTPESRAGDLPAALAAVERILANRSGCAR